MLAWENSRHFVMPPLIRYSILFVCNAVFCNLETETIINQLTLKVKWCLRNECRNSILMMHHYPDLGSASNWVKWIFCQSVFKTFSLPIPQTSINSQGNQWWHRCFLMLSWCVLFYKMGIYSSYCKSLTIKALGLKFFKGPFWGAYFWRVLSMEGNLRFKIDRASLIVGRKFIAFALF